MAEHQSDTIRWGIAGAGKICHDFSSCLVALKDEHHTISAVAARDFERAEEFSKKFNIPKAHGSYEELVNDNDVDVVYVGTIHPSHEEIASIALKAGKHVLCEKPLAMNLRQVKHMTTLAKDNNRFLMEGFWSRFFPVYDSLRRELTQNSIGETKFVTATFGVDLDHVARVTQKELGAGALMDLGCYAVQFAQLVFKGEFPEKIVASGSLRYTDVDESVCINLHYKNNRMAQLTAHSGVQLENKACIYGKKGAMVVPQFWCPENIIISSKVIEFPLPKVAGTLNFSNSNGFVYEARHVGDCIRRGLLENKLMTWKESETIMKIMDEVRHQIGVVYRWD